MGIIRFSHLSLFVAAFCFFTSSYAETVVLDKKEEAANAAQEKAEKAAENSDKPTPLNQNLKPNVKDDMIPSVYKDMVVVQRKAKKKAEHFLFAPSFGLDFSDGPITSYAINTDIGYAFSDFWEFYINVVPAFVTVERPIVEKVRNLGKLANNTTPDITYAKPQNQFGGVLLWAPAYGKESWGPYSIVRSDTFFKLSIADVLYAGGNNGMRYALMVGKTYFISNWLNIRVAAGIAYVQSIVQDQKSNDWAPVLETGLAYYF